MAPPPRAASSRRPGCTRLRGPPPGASGGGSWAAGGAGGGRQGMVSLYRGKHMRSRQPAGQSHACTKCRKPQRSQQDTGMPLPLPPAHRHAGEVQVCLLAVHHHIHCRQGRASRAGQARLQAKLVAQSKHRRVPAELDLPACCCLLSRARQAATGQLPTHPPSHPGRHPHRHTPEVGATNSMLGESSSKEVPQLWICTPVTTA